MAGCLTLLSSATTSTAAKVRASVSFPIATFAGEIYGLDYIAKSEGFFAKHGLNVSFISPSAGGGAANTLFLAGSVSAWAGNPQVTFTDITKGVSIKFAGGLVNWIPFAIQVPHNSALANLRNESFDQKMRALEGKKIGLTGTGALVYYDLLAALQIAGVPQNSVTIVGVGSALNGIGQLNAGNIDAYVTYSRTDAFIMRDQADTVQYADLSGSKAPTQLQAFSTWSFPALGSFESSHPDLVKAYIAAEEEAYKWGKTHISQAAQVISDNVYNGLYITEAETALRQLYAIHENPKFPYPKSAYEGEVKVLTTLGQLPAGSTSNPALAYASTVLPFARTK